MTEKIAPSFIQNIDRNAISDAVLAGIVGASNNTPMVVWSVSNPELDSTTRFPTVALAVHTGGR